MNKRKPAKPAPRAAGKPAKPAPRAAGKPAKPAPRAAGKPAKPAPSDPLPSLDDPFDTTPSSDMPGAYIGTYKGVQRRAALAYKRDDRHVWTVMFGEGGTRTLVKWGVDTFDANMRHAPLPLGVRGKYYPLSRAIDVFFNPYAIYGEGAYRVLHRLSKGQDPTAEDTIDDLLDTTPSKVRPRMRRSETQKAMRRNKRRAKLAAMTPEQLRAWRDKRNAARRAKRFKATQARKKKGGKQ